MKVISVTVAYPFGVIGIILVMILVRVFFRQKPEAAAAEYQKEIAEQSNVDCIYRISVIRKILTKAEEE